MLREFDEKIDELGGIEWVCEQVACGVALMRISIDLGYSAAMIHHWINANDVRPMIDEARKIASDVMVEQGMEMIDGANTGKELRKAEAQARVRMMLAEKWDSERYGKNKAAPVTINIQQQHLIALRQPEEIPTAEFEEVKEPERLEDPANNPD